MTQPASGEAGFGIGRAVLVAALAGFGVMAAELTAVRLQAPWFGDSAYVWTNVIGVILAALAGGATLGGALAGRGDARLWLLRIAVVSGLLLAVVPFLAAPVGGWLLPTDLPLDAAMAAIVRGSLVATALLFAPPMLLLGAVGPLLVTALVRNGVAVGRAAGTVSAAGTLGSLAGTFAATHWLVPQLGCRVTMVAAGGLLLLAALLVAVGRASVAPALALLVVAALGMLQGGPLRPAGEGRELLAERETPYQLLQVVREPGPPQRTLLLINEGLDSFHSIAVEGSALTGAYYDWHALAPLLAGDGARPQGLRALSIGDAAGSLRAVYAGVHPGAAVDGVDIDPETMALGAEFFAADKAVGGSFAMDGRVFVDRAERTWHVIHVDAYANQIYVPAHLASREFFAAVADRLEEGGVVACNVGALRPDDPVLRAIGATVASAFGHAIALRVPNSRNYLLVARKGERPDVRSLASSAVGGERLSPDDAERWRDIVAVGSTAARWHDVAEGGQLLVDDRPVLDELMMQSYVATRDDGVVVSGRGSGAAGRAELAAYEAAQNHDWLGVLAAARASATATSYLFELAGDARWSLRELHSARAEYGAALAAAEDATVRSRLQAKLDSLRLDLEPQQRAAARATANGWLAVVASAIAVALAAALYRMSRMPAAPSVSVLVDAR